MQNGKWHIWVILYASTELFLTYKVCDEVLKCRCRGYEQEENYNRIR
jgi:hypothetical protein